MRLGIFGGTFNPPHTAHLIGTELVREEFHLDRILFIPTYIPPHKEQPEVPPAARLRMLHIAIKDNPSFQLIDLEIKRRKVSYTIDTVREIKAKNPDSSLYLIMGTDQSQEFGEWKQPETLLAMLEFIIIARPGFDKEKISELLRRKAAFLELNIDISSTMIRNRIKSGKSIRYLVPEGVREYIIANGLYQ
jgi:nicotinate-nucleotide adenylyltransferase